MEKRICVIGGGPSGLTAVKSCLEELFQVVCFEKCNDIGGLWRYHDNDVEGEPSVMKSTIINTSKEMSAFSDYPPPKELANYMHNRQMRRYFQSYAENFDLMKHIKLGHEVLNVRKNDDYESTGKWVVKYRNNENGIESEEIFDGVMVCSGHHVYPNIPEFRGLEKFQGNKLHTHSLKKGSGFEDMKVLVIGIGNSAVDAAVEISYFAEKVYLSTRRGSWVIPRIGHNGSPLDFDFQRRYLYFLKDYTIPRFWEYMLEWFVNTRFDHEKFKLKPKHGILSAHPTVNDALPNCIQSGRVVVKDDVDEFVKDGVIFKGEDISRDIDTVIFATGYKIKYPFIGDDVLKIVNNDVDLYKLMFPPNLPHPSLTFIGMIQPVGCIFPLSEAQSRWYVQLMKKNVQLPSKDEMQSEIQNRKKQTSSIYVPSPRHTIQVYYVPYIDEISSQFGAKPNLWKMCLTDPKLFLACVFGPCTSYQYRLEGPHAWSGAREAVLTVNDRVNAPLNTCQRN